ncbi:MAG: hypothetical protein QP744_03455 [Winkia sp. UMB750A]|uniref:hypothetical protein n=1 Tax=unclassified Winkia TaxID=2692119 RepID=UPI002555CC15|nr:MULTISPECIES: hypothetical protein [unclassified Winkia]MDK8225065.1 hypothetical protein [Winkia sp. UMB750B]MDK8256519.1 hypothetical protein [Winkia sp. UMB750A]
MSEIDKATVWAMTKNMRLMCLLEYMEELEANAEQFEENQQIAQYLNELLNTKPSLLLGDKS